MRLPHWLPSRLEVDRRNDLSAKPALILPVLVVPALQRQRPSFDDLRADPKVPRIHAVFRENDGEQLVPVEDLRITGLPRAGELWLEAYKRWRAARSA
jgi:hypothetical protein